MSAHTQRPPDRGARVGLTYVERRFPDEQVRVVRVEPDGYVYVARIPRRHPRGEWDMGMGGALFAETYVLAAARVGQRVYFDPLPGETFALRIFGATTHLPLARADDERDALRIAAERGWTVVPPPFG